MSPGKHRKIKIEICTYLLRNPKEIAKRAMNLPLNYSIRLVKRLFSAMWRLCWPKWTLNLKPPVWPLVDYCWLKIQLELKLIVFRLGVRFFLTYSCRLGEALTAQEEKWVQYRARWKLSTKWTRRLFYLTLFNKFRNSYLHCLNM